MQRFFDIVFSSSALLVLSPLLIGIMIILKLTGEGEIFYRQTRVGRDEKMFDLLKFATMLKESPRIGSGMITVKNDPRVLPFGKFLRKTKLNELPQLINIVKGDMSVIGPRPMIPKTYHAYTEEVQRHLRLIRPGLSGIGSIVFRDEEMILSRYRGDRESYYYGCILPYKGDLEIWYVKNRSLQLYFMLIFLTVWVIIYPQSSLFKKLLKNLPQEPLCLQQKD